MNIFRRLYLWLRGETPVMWRCPICQADMDVKVAGEHLKTHSPTRAL